MAFRAVRQRLRRVWHLSGSTDGDSAPPPQSEPHIHGTYVGGNRMLISTTFGRPLRSIADDLSLTPELVTTGEYDRPFLKFLARHLHGGHTAVDVGANVGLFTVRMGQLVGPQGRVFAYEASPDVYPVLVENIELNYMSAWVTASACAADSSDGVAQLHVTSRFRGNASLAGKPERYLEEARTDTITQVDVATVRLDRVLADVGEIELIKVDVEGAERRVLIGMMGLLTAGVVHMVDLELIAHLTPDWEELTDDLAKLARDDGVTLSTISAEGELEPISLDEVRRVGRFPHVVLRFPRSG